MEPAEGVRNDEEEEDEDFAEEWDLLQTDKGESSGSLHSGDAIAASTAAPAAAARPSAAPSNTTSSEGQDVEHQPGPAAAAYDCDALERAISGLAVTSSQHDAASQLTHVHGADGRTLPLLGVTVEALKRYEDDARFDDDTTTERACQHIFKATVCQPDGRIW